MSSRLAYIEVFPGAAVLVAALLLSAFFLLSSKAEDLEDLVSIKLMEHESYIMPVMPSITTLTKYHVRGGIEQQLRFKIAEILEKNPWLTGRLSKSRFSRDVHLKYKQSAQLNFQSIVDDHFHIIRDCDLATNCSYDEYMQAFYKYSVARGNHCINNSQGKLLLVTLVYIKNSDDIVVVFSLSHMIADGCTFYALQNMLDRSTPVTAMEVVRSTKYPSELLTLFGVKKATWHSSWYIPVGLLACAFLRPRMRGYIVKVDKKWLDAQKAAYQKERKASRGDAEVDFISTNDILTAWHNRVSGTNVNIMAFNLRNRSSHFTNNMAGNYENSIMYNTPEDGGTPEAIRRSLSTVPYCNASNSVPGALKTLLWNGSLVTNWTSFYKQVEVVSNSATNVGTTTGTSTRCTYGMHIPVMTAGEMAVWREFMCIFNLDADSIGLLLFTRTLTESEINGSGVGVVMTAL